MAIRRKMELGLFQANVWCSKLEILAPQSKPDRVQAENLYVLQKLFAEINPKICQTSLEHEQMLFSNFQEPAIFSAQFQVDGIFQIEFGKAATRPSAHGMFSANAVSW